MPSARTWNDWSDEDMEEMESWTELMPDCDSFILIKMGRVLYFIMILPAAGGFFFDWSLNSMNFKGIPPISNQKSQKNPPAAVLQQYKLPPATGWIAFSLSNSLFGYFFGSAVSINKLIIRASADLRRIGARGDGRIWINCGWPYCKYFFERTTFSPKG
mgnify:CR=1 FL=1